MLTPVKVIESPVKLTPVEADDFMTQDEAAYWLSQDEPTLDDCIVPDNRYL